MVMGRLRRRASLVDRRLKGSVLVMGRRACLMVGRMKGSRACLVGMRLKGSVLVGRLLRGKRACLVGRCLEGGVLLKGSVLGGRRLRMITS